MSNVRNNSHILDYEITHARVSPKKYVFTHNFFWLCFDLMSNEKWNSFLVSEESFNFYSLYAEDHFPSQGDTLKQKYLSYLKSKGVEEDIEEMLLYTQPRTLGYVFNPLSLILFRGSSGKRYGLLEVANTFSEMKDYFIPSTHFNDRGFEITTKKYFYISPFLDHDNNLAISLVENENGLRLTINEDRFGEPVLAVNLKGHHQEASSWNLLKLTLKVPLLTVKTIVLIHYHAFVLWIKGIRYFKKNEFKELQRGAIQWKR